MIGGMLMEVERLLEICCLALFSCALALNVWLFHSHRRESTLYKEFLRVKVAFCESRISRVNM